MLFVKKISIILFILFLLVGVSSAGEKDISIYTFSYYSSFLNSVLFPEIEEYVSEMDLIPYSKQKGKIFTQGIIEIIELHLMSFDLLIPPETPYPVSLLAMISDNDDFIIYYVNITLPLIEYDTVAKIPTVLTISKNFFCAKEFTVKKEDI